MSFFHPKLPIFLVYMLQRAKYDPQLFIDHICKFPDLTRIPKTASTTRSRLYIGCGYYIWTIYTLAALVTLLANIVIGIIVILLIPLLVAGSLYVLAYIQVVTKDALAFGRKNKPKS